MRSAYELSGALVAECIQKGLALEELPLADYQAHSELFGEDLYAEISLAVCAEKRSSLGGTSVQSVENQIAYIRAQLNT